MTYDMIDNNPYLICQFDNNSSRFRFLSKLKSEMILTNRELLYKKKSMQ